MTGATSTPSRARSRGRSARRRVEVGAPRVQLGWAVGLILIAALEYVPSYQGGLAATGFTLAALVPFALVRLGVLARLGVFTPALVVIVGAGFASWSALDGAGEGLGDALPRLLTTPRPAPATAALLAPTLLLVALVAATVAACVLAPTGPDGRVRGLLAPVLGSALLYAGAELLSAGHADPHGIVAACLIVVAALGWSLPHGRGVPDGGLRMAWRPMAVLPLVVVVAVAVLVAGLVPAGAYDPRKDVTPPTVKLTEPSPLTQLAIWTSHPAVEIMQARVSGSGRLHLATLSTFTGADWQVTDTYHQLGLLGSGDLPYGEPQAQVTATVKLTKLGGVWLPAPGVPTSSSLGGVLIDPDSGTLARPPQVDPGLTYQVQAEVPAPSAAQLQAASVPTSVPARYLDLPDAPTGFAQYAREAIRGASTPLEEAIALEHAVSTGRQISPKAPSGSSYGRLQEFLFGTKGTAGAQAGSEEQFAAAFAVLAREVGLPSRLVVGFILSPQSDGKTVGVLGRDANVWPEVYFAGAGWVPFSPLPGGGGSSADTSLRASVLQRLSQQAAVLPVPPPIAPSQHHTTAPTRAPGTSAAAAGARSGLSGWALVGVIVGGGLVVLLLLLLGARRLRSARHRRHGASGAWAELVDLLVLVGRRPRPADAAPAVAAAFDERFPDRGGAAGSVLGAARIAAAAERESFGPGPAGPADGVWRDLRVLRRRAHRTLPVHRRLLLPVDPRPLLRRSGRSVRSGRTGRSGRQAVRRS